MAALIALNRNSAPMVIACAFQYAELFMKERKRQAEKRESELRASLNHD
jgi:hypothetical protein